MKTEKRVFGHLKVHFSLFRSFRWFRSHRFGRFVCLGGFVSAVLVVSVVSFRWFYFGVPGFSTCLSGQGIRPGNKKIETVANAPRPKCASAIRSILGLTNYCSRYVPSFSRTTYPLRQLTKSTTTFHWGKEQEQSFKQLKQVLASPQVSTHYSLTAPTRLIVDASPWALGSVLLQQETVSTYRPIAYGSRSLTEVEVKYAQIEKESLAIVFA